MAELHPLPKVQRVAGTEVVARPQLARAVVPTRQRRRVTRLPRHRLRQAGQLLLLHVSHVLPRVGHSAVLGQLRRVGPPAAARRPHLHLAVALQQAAAALRPAHTAGEGGQGGARGQQPQQHGQGLEPPGHRAGRLAVRTAKGWGLPSPLHVICAAPLLGAHTYSTSTRWWVEGGGQAG